ncbi:MAG: response regulator [Planctomycetota bacterium]
MMAYSSERLTPTERHREPVLYLLDDDTERLASLRRVTQPLGIEPRAFVDPEKMLGACQRDEVGCVISHLQLQSMDGLELQLRMNEADLCLSLILTTTVADVSLVVRAMRRGVKSVLMEPLEMNALVAEVRQGIHLSERASQRQNETRNAKRRLSKLNSEELAVLNLAMEGVPNREIAIRLAVSPRTVDRRRQSALQKLGAESITEFAILKTLSGM